MPTLKWLKSEGNYYYFKDAPVHISSIVLNKNSISLTSVGQTEQLTATVAPDDAVEKHVYWHSSDITVATVSQTGLVTCVTPGECVITASCDGVSTTCEVLKEKYFEVNLLIVGGGGSGGGGSWNGSGGGGGDVYCGAVEIPSSLCVTVGAGGDYWGGTRDGGQSSIVGSGIEVIANGGCVGSETFYSGRDPECYRGGSSGAGCKGGLPYNDNSGYTRVYAWAGGGGGGAGGNGCDAEGMYRCGGNGGPGICGYGGGGGGAAGCEANTVGCGVDGGGNGNGGNATNYGGGGGGACGNGCQGVVDICYIPEMLNINSATGGDCCYTCDGYCVHRFTTNGTFCIVS